MTVYDLTALDLEVGSPSFGRDPLASHRESTRRWRRSFLVAGVNDQIRIDVEPYSLVGSTREQRGEAQTVTIIAPLVIKDQTLFIDLEALLGATTESIVNLAYDTQAALAALEARILVLEQHIEFPAIYSVGSPQLGHPVLTMNRSNLILLPLTVGSPVFGHPTLTINA